MTKKKPIRGVAPRPTMPAAVFVRMFLIGALSIGAAAYGVWRAYSSRSARVPAPAPTEIEAPDLVKE